MTNAHTIVLLGGSGLGPWAWERVQPILDARGFATLTPTLRATGNETTPAIKVALSDWIEDVTNALATQNKQDFTLVAHSFAGYVAAGVLALNNSQIAKTVFLDAALPQPGKSWFDVMGSEVEQFMSSLAVDNAIPWFSRQQLDQLHPDHGISDTDFAWMQSKLTPQPIATYAQVAIDEPLDSLNTQLAYVQCLRSKPSIASINESTPGWIFRTLDAGHWPMITAPEATAQVIEDLVLT